jgi:elongation factor Tu
MKQKKRHYSHIDCPGHQDYIKNMIVGANQMDGVILVVSATDGVQVQTREHIILAKEIGIQNLIVFLNKIDAVKDKSVCDLVELEIRELIEQYGFSEDTIVFRGSAKLAMDGDENSLNEIRKFMEICDEVFKEIPKSIDSFFCLPVENVVVAQGRGTVVTGRVESGQIKVGDTVEIVGGRKLMTSICMGLETFHKILDAGYPGDNIGVLLKNIPNKEVYKGCVLATPNTMKCYFKFEARIYLLSSKEGGRGKPFMSGYKPQFFFRVSNVTGTIILTEDMAMPGEDYVVTVELISKSVINVGLRFVMREGKLTIGAGRIVKIIE